MNYTPNFNDPRVVSRCSKALAYACGVFTSETMMSQQSISKRFGQAQTDLGKWLRHKLLIITDTHYSDAAGISIKYIINIDGANQLFKLLFPNIPFTPVNTTTLVVNEAVKEFTDELITGDFIYREKSDRMWHDLQWYRKEYKQRTLKQTGYNHEYDIEAAAQSLLYQDAVMFHNLKPQAIIKDYIKNKSVIRNTLAIELHTTPDNVKKIITAIFAGAKIGINEDFQLFKDLDRDVALINRIKDSEYINQMRVSVRELWRVLPINDRRVSREKWTYYFAIELKVLREVVKYLKRTNNKHFREHDGWTTEFEIDEYQLIRHVREHTGYVISLSHMHLTDE